MDITNNELKGMKAKQLRRLVRETIEELMAETTVPVRSEEHTSELQSH